MPISKVSHVVRAVVGSAILLTVGIVFTAPVPSTEQWIASIFFTTFGLLASLLGYRTANGTTGTIGFLPFLSAALIAPNYAAIVPVAISVGASEMIARRSIQKALFNISQQVSSQGLAVLTYIALGGSSVLEGYPPPQAFIPMVTVFFAANKFAVSAVISVAEGRKTTEHWIASMRASASYDIFAFPSILVFSLAYKQFGPEWSALFALPMLGLRQLYKQNFALQKINEELLQLMVAAIEARDEYTSGHSQRVSRYARVIAKAAGISAKQIERITTAALLHDVGKIYEEFGPILRKADALTESELAIMRTHPQRGANLVSKVTHFADLVPAIEAHHESWDGRGYPQKLAGDEIPIAARIIALADTIDAMGTSRPYREAMAPSVIRAELATFSGRQFDPRICARLLQDDIWKELLAEIQAAVLEHPERAAKTNLYGEK
ncbi:MAG: HD-GYP domain-containing protein [Gemmatimonadota bacterium]